MLETLNNVKRTHKNVELGPVDFIVQQILMLSPIAVLVWVAGLVFLLRSRFSVLAWTYLITLAFMIALKGKNYYLAPVYPMLFAAGAVWWEQRARTRLWIKPALMIPIVVLGIIGMPLVLPVLEPATYIRYAQTLHFEEPKTERGHRGPLPQHFGDMFGWPEMVEQIAHVYNALPPDERSKAAIYANNYGEAGAVDHFGGRYGLPKAISAHNNYWLWGPRNYTGELMIVLGENVRQTGQHFATCDVGPLVSHPYAMAYEEFNILICRGLKSPLSQVWPRIKNYN
jgi:hypothetical protein